jgi:chemotaxis protein methyltransferase CheR
MREVEKRFGIMPNEQVERKMLRIFDSMPIQELDQWTSKLLSPSALEAEWVSLVESLTVHETYFNRDKDLMQMLQDVILMNLFTAKKEAGNSSLRIWSSACSSGEEVYNLVSLALQTLLKAGAAVERNDDSIMPLAPWRLDVLGTDISSQVIRQAKNAIYGDFGMGSFRDVSPRMMRFFELHPCHNEQGKNGRYFKVRPFVTNHTRFRRHNILDPMHDGALFDLIICRNVLIYFNTLKKREAQKRLYDALAPGGILILGTTDVLMDPDRYDRLSGNGGFWYVKK